MTLKYVLGGLRRITSKNEFIPEIDGLRFLAILPVVLMHADTNYNRTFNDAQKVNWSVYNHIISQGGTGVWVFFAISGFILSYFFAKHFSLNGGTFRELNLKTYYIRRLTRLEPPFLISMVILFFCVSFFLIQDSDRLFLGFLASITYTHNLLFGKWSPINPVTWSLEVEVQFYIIAPFLSSLLFLLKENIRNVILILLIVLIPMLVLNESSIFITNGNLKRTFPVYAEHFLVGILFTSIYTGKYWNSIKQNSYVWDLICFIAIATCFYLKIDNNINTHYVIDVCILLTMIGVFKGKLVNVFFTNNVIAIIGGMCYSIYLVHYAVIFGFSKVSKGIVLQSSELNYVFHISLSLIAVSIISIVFYKFCERPFMDKNWVTNFKNNYNKLLNLSFRL